MEELPRIKKKYRLDIRFSRFLEKINLDTDFLRPTLQIKDEIIKREEGLQRTNKKGRIEWLLENTYLTEGDLESLKNYSKAEGVFSHYPDFKRYKKISISVRINNNEDKSRKKTESKLKLALHNRGCNAGIYYCMEKSKDGRHLTAKAVPAILTRDI